MKVMKCKEAELDMQKIRSQNGQTFKWRNMNNLYMYAYRIKP